MEKRYYTLSSISTSKRKLILIIGFLPGFLILLLMFTTNKSQMEVQNANFKPSENIILYQNAMSSLSEYTPFTKYSKEKSTSFSTLMHSFPRIIFQNAVKQNDTSLIQLYSDLLLNTILMPFVKKEPPAPIDNTCKAPLLPEASQIFNCLPLSKPRKIGVLLNFGFDVDALKMHLNEIDSIADKFFSSRRHQNS